MTAGVAYLLLKNNGVDVAFATCNKRHPFSSSARAAPVPETMTGLFALFHNANNSFTACGFGPGAVGTGASKLPSEMALILGGPKRISIGKSTTTGPGAPEVASLIA